MKVFLCLILFVFIAATTTSAENIVFPPGCGSIIDVTQPPYNCDNTGQRDCTKALQRVFDDLLRPDYKSAKSTIAFLENPISGSKKFVTRLNTVEKLLEVRKNDPEALVGEEICSGIFPRRFPLNKIIYFPAGTYLVGGDFLIVKI